MDGISNDYHTTFRPMSALHRWVLAIYLVGLNLVLLTVLFIIWPGVEKLFPNLVQFPDDIRLLIISAVSAALGSTISSLNSFVWYWGNGKLIRNLGFGYVVNPVIGMTLGLFVYMAIRGGVLKTETSASVLNPYVVAAVAGVTGLWSRYILSKLREIAQKRFGRSTPGSDAIAGSEHHQTPQPPP
jgi:hypothetical protein